MASSPRCLLKGEKTELRSVVVTRKIAEYRKKVLLAEGRKKACSEEYEDRKKRDSETIATLKKDIKELTSELKYEKQKGYRTIANFPHNEDTKITYPPGAKSPEEALEILDLKMIDLRKKLDLLHCQYQKRQAVFNDLVTEYQKLAKKKKMKDESTAVLAQMSKEDDQRRLICKLENDIQKTNVQWMEAEHIRKKYKSIKGSLLLDSERFERSLLQLEQALTEQQGEINRLQEINQEALQMRDATKVILQRQEQSANAASKSRDRQAMDFRRQVEERKLELERLERKFFSAGKSLAHQSSIESSDQLTGKATDDEPGGKGLNHEMEEIFKTLMETTGATNSDEVLDRFLAQKEATARLIYLRTVTEGEKKQLEDRREDLNKQLEAFKFDDVKEKDVNQELFENLSTEVANLKAQEKVILQGSGETQKVIEMIRTSLIDLILKLQEVDEIIDDTNRGFGNDITLPQILNGEISDQDILRILEEKLRLGLVASGQVQNETDSGVSDGGFDFGDELTVPLSSPAPTSRTVSAIEEREKPQPMPTCYMNLMMGRVTGQISTSSPAQPSQPVATDDEAEVPSRSYLKKQAQVILDAKSRRKGFRPPVQRRK